MQLDLGHRAESSMVGLVGLGQANVLWSLRKQSALRLVVHRHPRGSLDIRTRDPPPVLGSCYVAGPVRAIPGSHRRHPGRRTCGRSQPSRGWSNGLGLTRQTASGRRRAGGRARTDGTNQCGRCSMRRGPSKAADAVSALRGRGGARAKGDDAVCRKRDDGAAGSLGADLVLALAVSSSS